MSKTDSSELSEILNRFHKKLVRHLKLSEAIEQLQEINFPSFNEKIVTLVGPSGVGKSTALAHFESDLLMKHQLEMEQNPSLVPVIRMTLQTGIRGNFDWKDAFIRMLEKFNEPLIRRKSLPRQCVELDGEIVTNITRLVPSELRRAVRNCCQSRGTKVILFDEASSLFTAATSDNYLLQFELVKSAVNKIQSRILLCGAYDLLKIEDFNGQLIRRTRSIHFDRYHVKELKKGDLYGESFRDTILTLLNAILIPKEKGLVDHADYFLLMSLGCIGNLKDWLARALEAALKLDKPILSREILAKTALSKNVLKKMLVEIRLGEKRMEDFCIHELAQLAGFQETPSLIRNEQMNRHKNGEGKGEGKKIRKPGKRAPSRDAVGANNAE